MSTIKTTYIQHPSAASPNLELAADGTVVLPLSDLEDLANVSGSPTDGQVLEYDSGTSSWGPATITIPPAVAGIGSNVSQGVLRSVWSTSTTNTWHNTGLSATITPTSASSKILILATVSVGGPTNYDTWGAWRISGGNATQQVGNAAGNRTRAFWGGRTRSGLETDNGEMVYGFNMTYLDSPSTTSPVTYQVQGYLPSGYGNFIALNRAETDSDSATFVRGASSIVVIEVSG